MITLDNKCIRIWKLRNEIIVWAQFLCFGPRNYYHSAAQRLLRAVMIPCIQSCLPFCSTGNRVGDSLLSVSVLLNELRPTELHRQKSDRPCFLTNILMQVGKTNGESWVCFRGVWATRGKSLCFFSEDKMQPRGNNSIVLSFHLHFLLIILGITAAQRNTFLHTIQHSWIGKNSHDFQ